MQSLKKGLCLNLPTTSPPCYQNKGITVLHHTYSTSQSEAVEGCQCGVIYTEVKDHLGDKRRSEMKDSVSPSHLPSSLKEGPREYKVQPMAMMGYISYTSTNLPTHFTI